MKKTVAFVLAGMLTLTCSPISLAEEEILSLDVSMIDPDVYEGSWITVDDIFDLYLPNDWIIGEVEDGISLIAYSEDETRSLVIAYEETDMDDLEAGAEALSDEGAEGVEYVEINGIPGLTYVLPQDDINVSGFITLTDNGEAYNIVLSAPLDDEDFLAIGKNIACSISPANEEAESES